MIIERGWGLEGSTNERPGTDHVILGPMRGLEKNFTRWHGQTHRHTEGHAGSMTNSAQRGRVGEKLQNSDLVHRLENPIFQELKSRPSSCTIDTN